MKLYNATVNTNASRIFTPILLVCASQRNQIEPYQSERTTKRIPEEQQHAASNNTRRAQYTHKKYEVVVRARFQSVFLTVYIMYVVHCTQCVSAHGL